MIMFLPVQNSANVVGEAREVIKESLSIIAHHGFKTYDRDAVKSQKRPDKNKDTGLSMPSKWKQNRGRSYCPWIEFKDFCLYLLLRSLTSDTKEVC